MVRGNRTHTRGLSNESLEGSDKSQLCHMMSALAEQIKKLTLLEMINGLRIHTVEDVDPRKLLDDSAIKLAEDSILVFICDVTPAKVLKIRSQLGEEQRDRLVEFLKKNVDLFSWKHMDMLGISPEVICHHLKIDPTKRPIKQKRRPMKDEKYRALKEEVD